MEKTYKITLRDIYGGDGFTRYIELEEQVLDRTKKTKRTRSDIGVSVENGMTEISSRKSRKEVNTFRLEDGKPVLRLGGMHGKFWGAMKEARRALYSLGKSEYRSQSLIDMIQIDPIWVKLNTDGKDMALEKLPQILNTMGKNTMIIQFYDCIPEATIRDYILDNRKPFCYSCLKQGGKTGNKPPIKRLIKFIMKHLDKLASILGAVAAALIVVCAQLYFAWKHPGLGMLCLILCVIFLVSSLFILKTLIATDRKDKELRILRQHFDEMVKVSSDIIPELRVENKGEISSFDKLHKFPLEFMAHFSDESNTWDAYCLNIKIHNGECEEFMEKLSKSFESFGLKVINGQTQPKSPSILDVIYYPLFDRWLGSPSIDFTKIDSNSLPSNYICYLYVSGYPESPIAYAENEVDKKQCRDAISSVADNIEYKNEAINLISSGHKIVNSVANLKSQFADTMEKIHKRWPDNGMNWGKTNYKFRRLKQQCPICEQLPIPR